jgi:hypothetical protein
MAKPKGTFFNYIHCLRNGKLCDSDMKAQQYMETFCYYYSLKDIKSLDEKISIAASIIESEDSTFKEKSEAIGILNKYGKIYSTAHL